MTAAVDRRNWLILSRREAEALLRPHMAPQADLERAIRVVNAQLAWLDEPNARGRQNSPGDAVRRDMGQ